MRDTDTLELTWPVKERGPEVPSGEVQVDFGALSHPGNVRPNNEDHYMVGRLDRTMQILLTNVPEGHLPTGHVDTVFGMLVADGMGGAAAGEVASSAAIRFLVDLVLSTPDWIMRLDEETIKEVMRRTEQRFHKITQSLKELALADPTLFGMGTTLTLVCSLGADMIIGHVGDSRAYLFRGGRLEQLTRDHTIVRVLLDKGMIGLEEAARHPLRNVLLNVLGSRGDPVDAEVDQLRLADGDRILLCTDGLTDMIPDTAIAEVLGRSLPSADTCQILVDLALEAGGKDNVTVVLGHYRMP
jgi:protein phosphatase